MKVKVGDFVVEPLGNGRRMKVISLEGDQAGCLFHLSDNTKVVRVIALADLALAPRRRMQPEPPRLERRRRPQVAKRVLAPRKPKPNGAGR